MDLRILKITLPLFILLNSIVGITQVPPPYFKFNIEQISSDTEAFLAKYTITTFSLRDSIFTEKADISRRRDDDLIRNIEGDFISAYIYSETMVWPREGDLIRFSLINKHSNEKMNIFIRIAHNMGYGDEFELTNLSFLPGDFFLDKCASKKKYQVSKTPLDKVDLLELKKHRISIKRLTRIFEKK